MRLSLPLTALAAALLMTGCAERLAAMRGGSSDDSGSGIQTRALDRAPATQAPSARSKPLSETNTPDAVAARQAQARSEGRSLPGMGYGNAIKAGPTRGEPAAPHEQISGFAKGAKAFVRAGAALRSRPNSGSDAVQSLVLDDQVTLDSRVYNAEGYWWYAATASGEDGWMSQGDLLQP